MTMGIIDCFFSTQPDYTLLSLPFILSVTHSLDDCDFLLFFHLFSHKSLKRALAILIKPHLNFSAEKMHVDKYGKYMVLAGC